MTQASDSELTIERPAVRVLGANGRLRVGRAIGAFCLYEAAFYLAYRYGMSFSHATASPFWFPDSVLLCALLLTAPRWWWVFVVGTLPIRLGVALPPDVQLAFLLETSAIDAAKGVITALILRRVLADPLHLQTVRDFVLYCLIAVLLVPAAGAFGGAGARALLGDDYWVSWQQWFLGNVLTHLVVTPAILYGIPAAARALQSPHPKRWIEGVLVATGLIVTGYVAFQTPPEAGGFAGPRFYLPVPFLFWAALRFGMFGASAGIVVMSVISVEAALEGHGPFSGRSSNDTALALQQFLLLRAAPLYLVALLIEQKQAAEHDLIASERRYREVVESQAELVCRFLPGGRLSFVNEAFCRAFMREREGLVGTDFIALLPAAVHADARAQIERATLNKEPAEWECRGVRPEEHVGWQHWLCHPVIGSRAQVEEFQAIGHDITDRKHAEELDRSLIHASRLAVVGEFTAMVAHEINQPLAAILTNVDAAEMLLESSAPPLQEIREILADIRTSDLQANETIQRIRALLGNREVSRQPVDLNAAILDVLRLAAGDLVRRHISVHKELAGGLPPASGDRVQLQQVLLNLFLNAMDAMNDTPIGSRLLAVSTRRDGLDAIEVAVADTGHGIAPDKLSSIFEFFFSTKTDGMGLGLAIARSIVHSHQGRIWAENRAGGGAVLRFTVQVAHAEKSNEGTGIPSALDPRR